jgi:hypothetical protein
VVATVGKYKYVNIKYVIASPSHREDALKGLVFMACVLAKIFIMAVDSLDWSEVAPKSKKCGCYCLHIQILEY